MKKLITTLLFLLPLVCYAQLSLERQVIGSTGNYSTAGTISLSATVGEPVVTTAVSGTLTLTQGFQQAEASFSDGVDDLHQWLVDYSLYPNPTQDQLTLELNTEVPMQLDLEVYDVLGRSVGISVEDWQVKGADKTTLSLQDLASGAYLLVLKEGDGRVLHTFKIEKQ